MVAVDHASHRCPELLAGTPLSGANADYVEAMYEQYSAQS